MKPCDQSRQVHLLHDGELCAADEATVRAHLAQCEACSLELQRLRGISRQFDMMDRARLPQSVKEQILSLPQQEQERSILRLVNRLTAMAASLAVAGTVWTLTASGSAAVEPPDSWEQAALLSVESDGDAGDPMVEWVLADLRWEQPR